MRNRQNARHAKFVAVIKHYYLLGDPIYAAALGAIFRVSRHTTQFVIQSLARHKMITTKRKGNKKYLFPRKGEENETINQ